MAVIALLSVKGAPGVTTAAVGLAARWERRALVVEADPAGGDLAARFGVPRSPGVPEWAAASRIPGIRPAPASCRLPGLGVEVVLGGSGEQMPTALSLLASSGTALETAANAVHENAAEQAVVLDLGRLDTATAALGLAAASDVVLLVTGGWVDCLDAVGARRDRLLSAIRTLRGPDRPMPEIGLLVIGETPFAHREIETALALRVLGCLPRDVRAAAVLTGRRAPGRAWTRSPLLRACRTVTSDLDALLSSSATQLAS